MKHGKSTAAVGRTLRCSDKSVQRWEAGKSVPEERFHYTLAAFLGVAITEVERLCQESTPNEKEA